MEDFIQQKIGYDQLTVQLMELARNKSHVMEINNWSYLRNKIEFFIAHTRIFTQRLAD